MIRSAPWLALVAMLASCGGTDAAPAHNPVEARRVEALNQRLDLLAATMTRLSQAIERVRALRGPRDQLAELHSRMDRLQAQLDRIRDNSARHKSTWYRRPDPARVYAIPIAGDPFQGPLHAKITIVIATEFACRYCRQVRDTLDEVVQHYGNAIKLVYKDYVVHHQVAQVAAMATCAAHRQGQYEAMADRLWNYLWPDEQFERARATLTNMEIVASEIGLDLALFYGDIRSGACRAEVEADRALLRQFGVYGTPVFFINGRFLSGAQTAERFKALIDQELKRADRALARGTSLADFYRIYVVERGAKSL